MLKQTNKPIKTKPKYEIHILKDGKIDTEVDFMSHGSITIKINDGRPTRLELHSSQKLI